MNEALKFLKSTLRLPSSKFPARPSPESVTRFTARCSDDLYAWQARERPASSHENFTLHDGPPYANSDLHVGHALNKITKDIICRSKLADGKRIDYIPGWDCHGLPIELKAFEKHGWERGFGVDPVKVRAAARGFAAKAVEKQMKTFRSWGIMADWDNHWKTMDKGFELRQLKVFKAMAEHGMIIRRHKPVYWSPSSQTALAEAEIERDEHTSTAAIVKFRIPAIIGGTTEPVHAVIWTTTPWTLPANQAIAVNKDIKYVLARSKNHGLLIVALSRVEYLAAKLKEEVEIVKVLEHEMLLECSYSGLPQFGEDALNRPFIHADFVTEDDGTGLVHCAPGHGQEDYEALQPLIASGRVKVKAPVNDKGEFTDAASPAEPSLLAGKYVFKDGNKAILEILKSANALITSYDFKHKYPVDWRTKQPIMIRATAQWFADISSIKADVLGSLENVTFRPESGKTRLESFVKNRSEWCISRQRAWGVPIPALYHKDTDESILTGKSIDHIIDVIRERGVDAWWRDAPDDPAWIPSDLPASEYVRGKDTMDVWFDSGTSWSLMAEANDYAPQARPLADVYLEGSDQHRGWFQSSILTNVAYQKATSPSSPAHAPFKQLVTHGFTLDGEGKKMSKSIGNVVNPDQIITGLVPQTVKASKKGRILHPLGPDALRLWAATGDWTSDVVVSQEVIGNVHKSLDKYRVTMKVLLGMLGDFDLENVISYQTMRDEGFELHRIALLQLYEVSTAVQQFMANYEFHKALAAINEWLARDLSAFYLESVKDSIYCDGEDALRRHVSQTVLYHIFCQFQHMLAPITPLLVEETYEFTPERIQQAANHPLQRVLDDVPEAWNDRELGPLVDTIMAINTAVKAGQEDARAHKQLGQSLACEVEIELISEPLKQKLSHLTTAFWESLLVVSKVHLTSQHEEKQHEWHHHRPIEIGTATEWAVVVYPPKEEKCARCWTYNAPKPASEEEPALCGRCADVVDSIKKEEDVSWSDIIVDGIVQGSNKVHM